MEYLKEENKNLITLRTSLITVIVILTSGLIGLILAEITLYKFLLLFVIGIYFDVIFLLNTLSINSKIADNIRRIKDGK